MEKRRRKGGMFRQCAVRKEFPRVLKIKKEVSMKYEIKGGAFPVVVCELENGEQMITE